MFYLALAHYYIGNRQMSRRIFHRVVKADDRYAEAWFNLGIIYETEDNFIEANRAYKRYNKILSGEEEEFWDCYFHLSEIFEPG